jgi:hypothetical protein
MLSALCQTRIPLVELLRGCCAVQMSLWTRKISASFLHCGRYRNPIFPAHTEHSWTDLHSQPRQARRGRIRRQTPGGRWRHPLGPEDRAARSGLARNSFRPASSSPSFSSSAVLAPHYSVVCTRASIPRKRNFLHAATAPAYRLAWIASKLMHMENGRYTIPSDLEPAN